MISHTLYPLSKSSSGAFDDVVEDGPEKRGRREGERREEEEEERDGHGIIIEGWS
jgi:hypothetical protein